MLVLDTCALIFDALAPEKLSKRAAAAIEEGAHRKAIVLADISLWEVAMLVAENRLVLGAPTAEFLEMAVRRRAILVLPISPRIADLAVSHRGFIHGDPADRLIGATAMEHSAPLVTCDGPLSRCAGLTVIW